MVKLLISLLIFPQLCLAGAYRDMNSWANRSLTGGADHAVHITLGTTISYGSLYYTDNKMLAASIPFVVGLIKESTDKNFDVGDLTGWTVGGIVGAYVAPWLVIQVTSDGTFLGIEHKY